MAAFRVDGPVGSEVDAFRLEEAPFSVDRFSFSFAGEPADAQVAGDDAVAGCFGSERVAPQRLTDGLGGPAADIPPEDAIGRDLPPGNQLKRIVDLAFEFGGRSSVVHRDEA